MSLPLLHAGPAAVGGAPFTPASLAGLSLWLQSSSIAQADGSAVSTWHDQSSFAATFSQPSGTIQPTYKVGIINGLPVLRCAAGDYLTCPSPQLVGSTFQVFQWNATPLANYQGLFDSATSADTGIWITNDPPSIWYTGSPLSGYTRDSVATSGIDETVGVPHIYAAEIAAPTTQTTWSINTDRLNAGRSGPVDYAEVIAYSRVLSSGEVTQVLDYLSTRYAITL